MPILIQHKKIKDHLIKLDAESLWEVDLVVLSCTCGWRAVKDRGGLSEVFDTMEEVSEHFGTPPPPEYFERRDALIAAIEAEGEEHFLERFQAGGLPVVKELWEKADLAVQDPEKEAA